MECWVVLVLIEWTWSVAWSYRVESSVKGECCSLWSWSWSTVVNQSIGSVTAQSSPCGEQDRKISRVQYLEDGNSPLLPPFERKKLKQDQARWPEFNFKTSSSSLIRFRDKVQSAAWNSQIPRRPTSQISWLQVHRQGLTGCATRPLVMFMRSDIVAVLGDGKVSKPRKCSVAKCCLGCLFLEDLSDDR